MLDAIVGFELRAEHLDGVAKLSLNKSAEDIGRFPDHLRGR